LSGEESDGGTENVRGTRVEHEGEGAPHPLGLEKMLRIYFLQQWCDLSDPQAEDSIYDSESMRRFVGIELGEDTIPDETTILRFRHLLEKHDLTEAIFREVRGLLEEKRLLLKSGTIVDATIVRALYGDKAYRCEGGRQDLEAVGIRYRVNRRGTEQRPLTKRWKEINRARSRVRARGEHAFHVVKRLWGFDKVRYRGLRKNAARAHAAFALANLYLVRHRLAPPGATYAL